jgi:hypothetical protein
MRIYGTSRAAAGWAIVFVVLLLLSAAMVTLPSASQTGDRIAAFYAAHGQVIVIQQIVGVIALAAFVVFALSLPANRWLRLALWIFVGTELATNVVPLIILGNTHSPVAARTWTLVEDVADTALSVAIAIFVVAVTLGKPTWLRVTGYVVAALNVIHGIGSLFGFSALDAVAPIAFVAFMLLLSARLLRRRASAGEAGVAGDLR